MEATSCKVSVVCTAYNHEPFLRDALEGFLCQRTDFPYEVLVNDDASTDGTAAILREYAEKYPTLIRPIYQTENQFSKGLSHLYDAILYPAARGRYIALCEGDDCWTDPEKLQRQADFLDAHPDYGACVHNTLARYMDGSIPDAVLFPAGTGDRDVPFETIVQGMSHAFHTSSVMARRELLLDPPEFRAVASAYGFLDYASALGLCLRGKIRFLDRCMSVYRIGSNPAAWSAGVDRQYGKLRQFVSGEIAMLKALLPRLDGERAEQARQVILEREYELLDIEGRVDEMVRPPYDAIYRRKSAGYKLKHSLKRAFPALHRLYRRRRGYGEPV